MPAFKGIMVLTNRLHNLPLQGNHVFFDKDVSARIQNGLLDKGHRRMTTGNFHVYYGQTFDIVGSENLGQFLTVLIHDLVQFWTEDNEDLPF